MQVASMGGPYLSSLVPKGAAGGSGGYTAKDALGNAVKARIISILLY